MKAGVYKVWALPLLIIVLLASGIQGDDTAWFDWENCAACKQLISRPGLWQSMKVETVKLSNGIAMIYSVAPDKLADYRAAHKEMRAVMEKALAGGNEPLCGHCRAMADLVDHGATREYVETSTGGLCLITAADKKVQEEIWSFQKKNEEMMQMMKPPEQKKETPQEQG